MVWKGSLRARVVQATGWAGLENVQLKMQGGASAIVAISGRRIRLHEHFVTPGGLLLDLIYDCIYKFLIAVDLQYPKEKLELPWL